VRSPDLSICSLRKASTIYIFSYVWLRLWTATEALGHHFLQHTASTELLPLDLLRTFISFEATHRFQHHALSLMVR